MKAGSTIKRILFIAVWVLIGGGMLSLLIAAISNKNKGIVKDYVVSFRSGVKPLFITAKDVEDLLLDASKGDVRGERVAKLNLQELELELEQNSWIDKAVIYVDNANILHVTVSEKKPVARVFTISDYSFFIDSQGRTIPVSQQTAAKLPVFTGFPATKQMSAADSSLLQEVRIVANYIAKDAFWTAQVAQIDITPAKTFEMIPVVGNHLVKLGTAEDIDRKFNRLLIFYKQVLSKTGFDRYKSIDVQYKGQVVVSRSEGNPKVDSIQLRRNVDKLLKQSIEAEKDTVVKLLPIIRLEADSTIDNDPSLEDQPVIKATPVPAKPTSTKPASTKPVSKREETKRKPKAVMLKKQVGDNKDDNN